VHHQNRARVVPTKRRAPFLHVLSQKIHFGCKRPAQPHSANDSTILGCRQINRLGATPKISANFFAIVLGIPRLPVSNSYNALWGYTDFCAKHLLRESPDSAKFKQLFTRQHPGRNLFVEIGFFPFHKVISIIKKVFGIASAHIPKYADWCVELEL
jgi:hypothetical protein